MMMPNPKRGNNRMEKYRFLNIRNGTIRISLFIPILLFLCNCGSTPVKRPIEHEITDLIPKDVACEFLNKLFIQELPDAKYPKPFTMRGVILYCSGSGKYRMFKYENIKFDAEEFATKRIRLDIWPVFQESWSSGHKCRIRLWQNPEGLEKAKMAATALSSLGAKYVAK
jgi:hypothetical protein